MLQLIEETKFDNDMSMSRSRYRANGYNIEVVHYLSDGSTTVFGRGEDRGTFLPEFQKFYDESDFKVQTTSYGTLPLQDIEDKVVAGYLVALEVIKEIKQELGI